MENNELLKEISKGKLPKHVAITLSGIKTYMNKYGKDLSKILDEEFKKIHEIINLQMKLNIPILTVHLFSTKLRKEENYSLIVDKIADFFKGLKGMKFIDDEKVKVSILGKWYDLPERAIEPIKELIEQTKDYDSFFLNFCVNYDGKEELVDAMKIIGKKIQAGKLDPDAITEEDIKDNIYSSYFLPPDMIIKTGKFRRLSAFLLWDSTDSFIYFPNKYSPECSKEDFLKAIKEWQQCRVC